MCLQKSRFRDYFNEDSWMFLHISAFKYIGYGLASELAHRNSQNHHESSSLSETMH